MRLAFLRPLYDAGGDYVSVYLDGGAVERMGDTMAALSDGRAAEVLVAGGFTADGSAAWIRPGGADLGGSPARLAERGISEPLRDRADAAVARAVACTDAELFFLPEDVPAPRDGIGATLRY